MNNVVIRGDLNEIFIDDEINIFENCSLSTVHAMNNNGQLAILQIYKQVTIMPNCSLVSCEIEKLSFIGNNSVVCEGSKIDIESYIGPNSVVPPGRYIPPG